ncbi:hypothetical protein H920_17032 [Fukomys damarensis]|uniref:Uncharacterized protein n=1 Tax=Fukomys damarensis TaxID=885580 RepID=A0A091CT76_FUKDA|nr:hypothetical protein H920_17032 [Fukomys damarensis]
MRSNATAEVMADTKVMMPVMMPATTAPATLFLREGEEIHAQTTAEKWRSRCSDRLPFLLTRGDLGPFHFAHENRRVQIPVWAPSVVSRIALGNSVCDYRGLNWRRSTVAAFNLGPGLHILPLEHHRYLRPGSGVHEVNGRLTARIRRSGRDQSLGFSRLSMEIQDMWMSTPLCPKTVPQWDTPYLDSEDSENSGQSLGTWGTG